MSEPTGVARRCKARNRAGEPCGRIPGPGAVVCASHGGKSPVVRAAAGRRQALAEAEAAVSARVADRGALSLVEVYQELSRTAGMVVAWRDVLAERLDDLGNLTRLNGIGTEQVRAEVVLFERALDRSAKVLELIGRLDLDARMNTLSREQGDTLASVINYAVNTAEGLTAENRAAVLAAVPAAIRRVAGAGQ